MEIKNSDPNSEISGWMQFYDDLGITSLHPFLLFIVTHEKLTDDERNEVFALLESYIVRWMLCCGNNEDRINGYRYTRIDNFLSEVIKKGEFRVKEFVNFLSESSSSTDAWPKNEQIKDALRKAGAWDVDARLIVYILYRIELLKRQGEYQDADVQLCFKDLRKGTREHIMPRKWSDNWPLPLGEEKSLSHNELYSSDYKDTESEWRKKRGQIEYLMNPDNPDYKKAYNLAEKRHDNIDSIGNLIPLLKDLNEKLSDRSFNEKKQDLKTKTTVNLLLTKEILDYDSWDVEQICKREQDLCDHFFKVWQPAEYFLKSKSDKMIESEDHVFISNCGQRKLTKIKTNQDGRVMGIDINDGESNLDKSSIFFACSVEAWLKVKADVENRKGSPKSDSIQVEEWLLESAQKEKATVQAIVLSGHRLRGTIEDFDAEAIYLKISQQTVIVYKQSLCKFITEGRPFRRKIKSIIKKQPNYNYAYIKFSKDPNRFHVERSDFKRQANFDLLESGSEIIFNIAQTEVGLYARDVKLEK